MNHPDATLKEFLYLEKGALPVAICDYIVSTIKERKWVPHTWYNQIQDTSWSEKTKELDVQDITPELQDMINPYLHQTFNRCNEKLRFFGPNTDQIAYQFSTIRFNKYSKGQIMRQHHDHIYSIFDGDRKGIPILSIIINFNEDYKGADLYFWEDYVITLGKGDILMFPSLFLYPHGVTEALEGERYSGVSWAW
jgi:predicted 2-oxoglutarate/Fe(II)-dependent dioxygenase YbiX|tara:strand:- start:4018 stop:4599 length:582 start_codon:yes stop_codon:yes gene_type:complete